MAHPSLGFIVFIRAIILFVLSYFIGHGAQLLRLPLITGYLFAGVMFGPSVTGLLPKLAVHMLHPLENVALAIIAFAAGAELHLPVLQEHSRTILWTMGGLVFCTFTMLFGTMTTLSRVWNVSLIGEPPPGSFGASLDDGESGATHSIAFCVCLLVSTVLVARSPASAIAQVKEMRSSGPFTTLTLTVSVAMDVVVIAMFSVHAAIVQSLLGDRELTMTAVVEPFSKVAASAVVGLLTGALLQAFPPLGAL